jgi:serine/threonine protein phosphatase 1
MRTLVISDIHGCYQEFMELLNKVQYNAKEDQLILLGDYMDRGPDSKPVILKVAELVQNGAIAIRGNHDDLFLRYLNLPKDNDLRVMYFQNGGMETIKSFIPTIVDKPIYFEKYIKWAEFIKEEYRNIVHFLTGLPLYYEGEKHIFVHAGINPFLYDWKKSSRQDFLWNREPFLSNNHEQKKIVVFGHTPTINLQNSPDPYFNSLKIGIDGGCCFGYQLNCLEINHGKYHQYKIQKGGCRHD